MRRRAVALLALTLGMAAAGQPAASAADDQEHATDWRRVAVLPDRDRLRRLRIAWVEGIRLAYAKGAGPAVRAEGVLLDPDVALSGPIPPAGDYHCRVLKMGGVPGFVVLPPVSCRVTTATGGALAFSMLGKTQRTAGRIFADTDIRGVFLGALAMPEERRVLAYGRDTSRDMVGVVRRVGEKKWRIAFPYPRFESTLDVIELTPET